MIGLCREQIQEGNSEIHGIPKPERIYNPPMGFKSVLVSSSSGMCLEILQREVPGRHPDLIPEQSQLTSTDEQASLL